MIKAFSQAVSQLGDISFRRFVWLGLAGSATVFFALWFAIGFLIFSTEIYNFYGILGIFNYALEWVTDIFGFAAVLFLSWMFFPSVVSLVVSFFLEDAAQVVEEKYYPTLTQPRRQGIKEVMTVTLKFSLLATVLNILALPVYALLFFIGPLNLVVFYVLNGYVLGREFFEVVAHRRSPPDQVRHLRHAYKGQLFLAGVVIAFMMTIPIVNLIAPVIATAAMVHLSQNWRSRLERI